jgi:hypothetical protein
MRALPRSYGDISTFTRSPTLMRMKFLRILPEIWASTSWPLGSATRNIVPGKTCVTEPVNSIGSSFAKRFFFYMNMISSCLFPAKPFPVAAGQLIFMAADNASIRA